MKYLEIFLAFFVSNILGYGGGPSTIPLIEYEVVTRYGWMTVSEFAEVLALGNALPSPIATKMAGYIGFQQGGVAGSVVALLATMVPATVLMLALTGILYKFKDSPKVKFLTCLIRPTIAVLLGSLTIRFVTNSYGQAGLFHTLLLMLASFVFVEKMKIHPAFVITGAIFYGAFIIA